MERIKTGIESLDDLLKGGFPQGSSILLAGMPGVGKSILANQIAFNFAAENRNVIYLTTLSEPQVKILKFQQEFAFFDLAKFQKNVIYYDLGSVLRRKGPSQTLIVIDELLCRYQPGLIIIDTIKTLTDMIPSIIEFREFLLDLSLRITTWGGASLLLGEYSEEDVQIRSESAIVDGIIYLYGTEEKSQQKRYLRILKMRGTDYPGGENCYKISREGINIYPRLNPNVAKQSYGHYNLRLQSGISGLDEMMGGGIPKGTTTIISGASGTGKTLLALHIIIKRLQAGESVLYISFEENPEQIILGMERLGHSIREFIQSGLLEILHISPMEMDVDELVHNIQVRVNDRGTGFFVLDSISSFELGMINKIKYTDFIWALSDYLKSRGVTAIFIHEIHDSVLVSELTKHGISFMADNIILLRYLEQGLDIKRFIRIVKMRSSNHMTYMKEVCISYKGFTLGETPN